VSHDRYFLERVCDRTVALLGDGRLRDLPGGVDEYLALRRASLELSGSRGGSPRREPDNSAGPGDATQLRADRKELARLDKQLERLRRQEATLHDELAAAATDHEKVLALDVRLREVTAEQGSLEEQWLEVAQRVDDLSGSA
jgi:ATPase subunit of ABC transporter with duplicated ATPase domains